MKARRPSNRKSHKLPELGQRQLPKWVSMPVADCIIRHTKLADEESERELLRRLGTDSRMEQVWKEIYKRKGSGANPRPYFNKAFIWPETRASADGQMGANKAHIQRALNYAERFGYLRQIEPGVSEQDDAAVLFFERVFISGLNIEPNTNSERQQFMRGYQWLANEERLKASRLSGTKAKSVLELAWIYDEHVELYRSEAVDDPTMIFRVRGDIRERSLVLKLLMITNSIFHKNLLNTIGTVAAVILNSEKISRDRVNGILRFSANSLGLPPR